MSQLEIKDFTLQDLKEVIISNAVRRAFDWVDKEELDKIVVAAILTHRDPEGTYNIVLSTLSDADIAQMEAKGVNVEFVPRKFTVYDYISTYDLCRIVPFIL